MNERKPRNPFGRTFIKFCDEQADRIIAELVQTFEEGDKARKLNLSSSDIELLSMILSDELTHFFMAGMKLHVNDPDGLKRLMRITSSIAGRKSAAKRSTGSTKQKFIEFALEQNRKNPGISKNAIAEMYARKHPAASVGSLRRYLADIPIQWVD